MKTAECEKKTLSIVVPVYNEAQNLNVFYSRTVETLEKIGLPYEIIYINDGSTDETLDVILEQRQRNPNVKVLDFSRNFGKETALTAGIDFAKGDGVIPIDADLQDPPELMAELVHKWQEGYDVVYATRTSRIGESWMKKTTANVFYRMISKMTRVQIPRDTGDFRLMSRQVVDALRQLRERRRFMKGLFGWTGFNQTAIFYDREPRLGGHTTWNYWKLANFAMEGVTSFSDVPLQIISFLGLAISFFSFLYGLFLIGLTIFHGNPVPGYPSVMVMILFLGGVQLVSLGVIGEYVGRIYDETKQRPLYILKNKHGFE